MKHVSLARIALCLTAAVAVIGPGSIASAALAAPVVLRHSAPDLSPAVKKADTPTFVESTAGAVQQEAETRFASTYGATRVTEGGKHVVVYLTSLSAVAEAQLRALGLYGQVSFARTTHTRVQLLALQRTVTGDVRMLATRGVRVVSWFPGINGDGLEHIGVLDLTAMRARMLDRLFGASNIVLHNVARSQIPQATASRVDDYAPWNGGDNLTSHGIGCTSGVGIVYQGAQYMLTAAHCYEPGWSIYNEFAGVSRPNNLMGTETSRDVNNGGDDTALVSMPVLNHIWTGVIGSPVPETAVGDATNPDGDTVYNEGAYSGQVPATVQNNYYGCIYVSGVTGVSGNRYECNIVEATSSGIANQDGDSGAPMIRYIGGNLMVTGIVSAGSGVVGCQYNVTTCYNTVYYTAMDEILSDEYPGATIEGTVSTAAQAAINWAEARDGDNFDNDLCLLFVSQAYEAAGINIGSVGSSNGAYQYWQQNPEGYTEYPGNTNPPVGALVFWGPTPSGPITFNNPYGHVGIYIGNNTVISTSSWPESGPDVHEWSFSARNAAGYPYLGWLAPAG